LAILDCNGETVLLEDAFSIEKAMEKGCRLAGLKCVTVYDQIRSALYELEKGRVKASWSGSG
ncbi:MAG: hypothetical protein LRS43_01165, partial [Desulfurococcales archaeon]|nr:hypothetical protein [Desulfurococcales archaeon]